MKRTTRSAAGALALALALGAGTPLASAAGPDKAAHAKADKGGKADKGEKGKQGGQEKKVAQELRQLLRGIAQADARLARVEKRSDRAGEHAAAVLANVTADRAALAELATAAQAADSTMDLREVRKAVRDLREENYDRVVNDLRQALELAADIAAARTALEGDANAPVAELDAAQAAVDSAVGKALLVTASSDKEELRAVKADLEAAQAAFDVVSAYLDSLVVEEEPVEEEPIEEEPVVEEPVV